MDINKVLFISQEISPYVNDNEMSLASRMLAQGVQEKGIEVRTFMPKYGFVNARTKQLHEVKRLSGMNLIIDDTDHPLVIKVATLQPARLQVYFIYNEDYFTPETIPMVRPKDLEIVSHPDDNDERSIFYVRGVLETVKKLRWIPSVIQCSGWITALAPLYIKKFYNDDPSYRDAKVVMSLFDEDIVSPLNEKMAEKLAFDGFEAEDLSFIADKQVSYLDLMKLAIANCDAVMQCSPNVSEEVLELVKESQLPFLPYQESDTAETMNRVMEFYHSL
jgi:starch synthase